MSRAFVNTKFERLKLRLQKPPCQSKLEKPKNWDHQVRVVSSLAKNVPGIVRIDLYAGDDRIIFSEFTYTTGFCANDLSFKPHVADGLLLAFNNGGIDPSKATPEFVKNTIHGTSWVFVTLVKGRIVSPASSAAFPSPVDLCESVNNNTNYNSFHWDQNEKIKHCITVAKEAANRQLHCIVGSDINSTLWGVSDHKIPSMSAVMSHVDWGRALTLFFAVILMTKMKVGTTPQKNQYINNILYYAVMAIVMRLTLPHVKAMFSNHSILDIVRQSFEAFRYVHPMESPHIALSHFTTYWFGIAAWRSRSLRNFFFWQLLRETVSATLNEYCHLIEDKDIVHCSRVAFIASMKEYAFDNLIREYLVAPFFVYGYLLPKFIIYWSRKMLGNNAPNGMLLFLLMMCFLVMWHVNNKNKQRKMTLGKNH
ncbi:hypothetical protein HJC23_012111 [Cyclotella cryptica]|uniref:LAGLIDADG homing endonuclease n=1 Tax=Cyclotella cryptica TaxID=29204 RepID=A0ABD3P678_9STRA